MVTKSVLIVSTSDDAHVNHIAPLLLKRGARVLRINGDTFPSESIHQIIDTKSELSDAFGFQSNEIDVVWYRKVVLQEKFDATSQFVKQETEGLLSSLLLEFEGRRWVNNRFRIECARPKLHQLRTAARYGFRTPASIVTNQEADLVAFFHSHAGEVVVKPIQTQVLVTPERELVVGTRTIGKNDFAAATQFFPCFAQERLKLKHEIRVIVFRDQFFGFRLVTKQHADDLKQLRLDQIEHSVCKLEKGLEDKIHSLMSHYGLEFGAFDFGVTDDDEPYFLELNPNGQWLWLQFMTGFDLETPFINLLLD